MHRPIWSFTCLQLAFFFQKSYLDGEPDKIQSQSEPRALLGPVQGDASSISLGQSVFIYIFPCFLGETIAHCHNTQHGPVLPLWSGRAKDSACSLLTDA